MAITTTEHNVTDPATGVNVRTEMVNVDGHTFTRVTVEVGGRFVSVSAHVNEGMRRSLESTVYGNMNDDAIAQPEEFFDRPLNVKSVSTRMTFN